MYIKVRVTVGAKKELVKPISKSSYTIHTKEPAERNLANAKVRELLARELGIEKAKIKIINGHHSPSKLISIQE